MLYADRKNPAPQVAGGSLQGFRSACPCYTEGLWGIRIVGSGVKTAVEEGLDEPSVEERRELIDRVATSAQFGRSTRLRDFLLYVGSQSLKEDCPEIHEQEIGAKVFGRSASYDRSQDNIVRVNATELRKRIELYFATEGAHEPLILEIPRGGYMPIFYRRVSSVPAAPVQLERSSELAAIALSVEESFPAVQQPRRAHFLWIGIAAVLAIACIVLLQQNTALRSAGAPWAGRPEVEAFWKEFAKGQQEIDIVLPDASLILSEELTHRRMTLDDYLDHNYVNHDGVNSLSPDRVSDLRGAFSHNIVTLGDFRAAQQILALTPLTPSLRLQHARFYTVDSIKRNSFILIGGRKSNPWTGLFDEQMNFSLDFDTEHSQYQSFVTNHHPRPDEQAIYTSTADTGYSVIAYLPNPSGTGNVIVLAGTGSEATSVAAEFLTSENSLAKFHSMLKVQKFPHFEVLLKTSRMSGTSYNAELLAYRTYPGS